jgi:hypothetical protein
MLIYGVCLCVGFQIVEESELFRLLNVHINSDSDHGDDKNDDNKGAALEKPEADAGDDDDELDENSPLFRVMATLLSGARRNTEALPLFQQLLKRGLEDSPQLWSNAKDFLSIIGILADQHNDDQAMATIDQALEWYVKYYSFKPTPSQECWRAKVLMFASTSLSSASVERKTTSLMDVKQILDRYGLMVIFFSFFLLILFFSYSVSLLLFFFSI